MKQRLEQIRFLNVTTSMLPYGVPFPVIPQSAEIMNIIVPDMMQNALTKKMTVAAAADDAAKKIKDLLSDLLTGLRPCHPIIRPACCDALRTTGRTISTSCRPSA